MEQAVTAETEAPPLPDLLGRWRQVTAPFEGTEVEFEVMDELLVATVTVAPLVAEQAAWERQQNPKYQDERAAAAAGCASKAWAKGVRKFASVRRAGQRIWTGIEVTKAYFHAGFFSDECAMPNPVGLEVELILAETMTLTVRDPVRGQRSTWSRVP